MVFAFCLAGSVEAADEGALRITVLHTNDHHGRFWRSPEGEYGLAARKTIVERVRQEVALEGGHVLLLDAGDVNTGSPESDRQNAEPDFRGMSALGYDAMAVGNHEFDRPASTQDMQRHAWSSFPWLSANVYRGETRFFDPYKVFTYGSVRIAVLGLTTEDTAKMNVAQRYPGARFENPISEARRLVPALRARAEMVIVLSHMGHYADGAHGSSAPGDVELARAVPGIDLIVGGHTHSLVCMLAANVRNPQYRAGETCEPDRQNGTWIVQAADRGQFVGRADFEVPAGGPPRLLRYRLLPVNLRAGGEATPEDEAVNALLRPFADRAEDGLAALVGNSMGRFIGDRVTVRQRPTALGVLLTTAMRQKTGADIAIVSAGGIRDSLPAGPLTVRDIVKVLPFGNEIVVVTLDGDRLAEYLATASRMTPGSGAYAQITGVRMVAGSEGAQSRFFVDDQPLEPAKRYRVAISSFVAKGGDGYPDLSSTGSLVATGFIDSDTLREFITQRGRIDPADFQPPRDSWPQASGL